MATPGLAANAYAQAARIADAASAISKAASGAAGDAAGQGEGQGFGAILKEALGEVRAAGVKSDAQSRALAAGSNKANLIDVVTAVAETETAVNTLVSVRDRVVAAYQQILQMQI
jgi:flagellar hook-basal body complex protein FliE